MATVVGNRVFVMDRLVPPVDDLPGAGSMGLLEQVEAMAQAHHPFHFALLALLGGLPVGSFAARAAADQCADWMRKGSAPVFYNIHAYAAVADAVTRAPAGSLLPGGAGFSVVVPALDALWLRATHA